MKVSKVVLIVVALHVLVIGGIFIFEGCSRSKSSVPALAENETPAGPAEGMTPTAPDNLATLPTPQGPPTTANALTPATPVTPPPVEAAAPAPATRTHVVKKGDSLWRIAKLENTSVGELARANKLTKTSTLKIGQKLTIPAAKTEPPTVAAAAVAPVSPDAGAAPASADVSGANYTVKSGDSLWKIARQQKLTVAAIKQANNLTSDSLKIGQKLRIPSGSATVATAAVPAGSAPSSSTAWREPGTYSENGQTIHVVDFNESPSVIAQKYGIKLDDLLKANNISDAKRIQYGQRLVIPLPQANAPATSPTVTSAATPSGSPITAPGSTAPAAAAPVVSASQAMVQ
ncbi:MAG TPA: LysM peptidoglycan-binding domain-containing protein [Verrucomicrobiae bacterium]|nr:LysM peptidoglycan-binding domain-containing protein [Verrucomicrobiae bacterium]